ncbi:MAG: hypothetical protein NW200_14895 [Hyphomonadaceae bacterium]|nr:hypothetical protein [Hyphomonadaceae bacterium]
MSDREIRSVVLVTKLDRAAIDAEIAESGMAFIDLPQSESCKFKGVSGDLLFWAAEVEIDEVDD